MEEISFKGESYIKGSILAEKYGYTSDYIGQLCRGNQVKSTLVGRTWYVNEESLLGHKKGRYRSTLAKSKEMVRKLAEERMRTQQPTNVKRIVRYESDERDLLPNLTVRETILTEAESQFEEEEVVDTSVENLIVPIEIDQVAEKMEEPTDLRSVPITRHYRRAPVRTIPAFVDIDRPVNPRVRRPVEKVSSRKVETHSRSSGKKSLVPALIALFLVGELLAISAALGLEKRVTTTATGQEVVVYDFEPGLLASAVTSLLDR